MTKGAVDALNRHPLVAKCWKQSTGVYRGAGGTRVTVAPPGLPDIMGWTTDGRMIGIEVKKPGKAASFSEAQLEVAHLLSVSGCVTGTITTTEQALAIMDAARRR